jgi:hypothetical protein
MSDGSDEVERLVSFDTTGVDHVTCILHTFNLTAILSYTVLPPSAPSLSSAHVDYDGGRRRSGTAAACDTLPQ